jgi:hypothetical protein
MYDDLDVLADPAQGVARLQDGYPLGERAIVEQPLGALAPDQPPAVELRKRDQTRVESGSRATPRGCWCWLTGGIRSGG